MSIERRKGRPRRTEDRADAVFCVRLTRDERTRLTVAALVNRVCPATFARDAIVTAIEDTIEDQRSVS